MNIIKFKDCETINQRRSQLANINILADLVKDLEKRKVTHFNGDKEKKEHNPKREKCDYKNSDDSDKNIRTTEKRMCRCMYYYNLRRNEERCNQNCNYPEKWMNISPYTIEDYEYPSKYVNKGIGGVDLLIHKEDKKYVVEIKPERSTETIVRMIAEILTYVMDVNFKDYEPAICFFKDSKQDKDYEELCEKNF